MTSIDSVRDEASESTASGQPSERSGADAIADTLRATGVDTVFGFPGGGTPMLLASLLRAGTRALSARTELSAAWMSYGYNRTRRRAASALLFHEVGVLHAAPAIYAAKLDSTPLVVMDVNLASSLDLREALQEGLDIFPALKQLTKYIRKIVVGEDLPLAIRQSVLASSTGRFGPAVLDMNYQVLSQPVMCPTESFNLPEPPGAPANVVESVLAMLDAAERPVLVVGAGVGLSGGAAHLRELAESLGIPVVSTGRGGRGILPDDHPLYGGPLGSFGWTCANEIAQQADLWIALGTSFSQVTTAAWTLEKPAKVVHVDIDGYELGKIFEPTLGVVADAATFLRQLSEGATRAGVSTEQETLERAQRYVGELRQKWWSEYKARFDGTEVPLNQLYMIDVMNRVLPPGSVVVGDSGGQAGMIYRGYAYDGIGVLPAGPRYQSMGSSLPIAIGAKLADPERTVVSYHGDGGFYYDFMDLSTLSEHNIKVIVIIDNNGCLLANRSGMKMMGFPDTAGTWTELPPTDFVGIANNMGVDGELVTEPGQFEGALQRATAATGSYLIDARTDPETRMKRAIPGVIPMLSDRNTYHTAAKDSARKQMHFGLTLDGAWPQ